MSAHQYYCSLFSHKSKPDKAYLKETLHEENKSFSLYVNANMTKTFGFPFFS